MSLHNLAQHLQSAGRGDDKMLVHMTPKEVGGLQALAMAHGGSLTVNPNTGLPEAGFLSSILPMVAGAALTGLSGGAINPMTAGLITGAAGTAMTGSLGKGLMMGLGAYGGAGMMGGLTAAGTEAAVLGEAGVPSFLPMEGVDAATQAANLQANQAAALDWSKNAQAAADAAAKSPFSTALKGVGALGSDVGRATFMSGMGQTPYSTYASLGSTAMNQYYDELEKMAGAAGGKSKALIRPYELEREYSSEPDAYGRYFRDTYTALAPYRAPGPEYRAAGGLLAFSDGGMPVEQMSRQAAIGANTRYPMASQTTSTYASPAERPVSENVINPPGYMALDPYTGAQRFADGGDTGKYAGWSKTKTIVDEAMLKDIYSRMGGTGDIPENLKKSLMGNKRSEADVVNAFRKDPYFGSKSYTVPGVKGNIKGVLPEDREKLKQFQTDRINAVAQATLGRNATPEEFNKLNQAQISLAGMGDWFKKNAKDEYSTYQQKAYEQRQKTAAETKAAGEKAAAEAKPENWATPTQTANMFRQTFGRAPTADELKQYSGMNMTPDNLLAEMKKSDMYGQRLTGQMSGVGTPGFTTDAQGRQRLAGALGAPETATSRLGLGQFYGDMNDALRSQMAAAGRGMQFSAPGAQTNLSALDQYYAPAGTNIAQGSAEQAQLASLLASQNVANQAAMYGIGPTVARAGAQGMSAPRFTSSGNIYSAGFYSPQYGSATPPTAPLTAPNMGLPPAPQQSQVSFAMAQGGIADLGGYSDGGRLLKGPGDGVSDSIPASIGDRRPARLADGEFVIPARIVSELGNGSTEAGARQLYAMMDRVQKRRSKTVGKDKVAVDSGARKVLPA